MSEDGFGYNVKVLEAKLNVSKYICIGKRKSSISFDKGNVMTLDFEIEIEKADNSNMISPIKSQKEKMLIQENEFGTEFVYSIKPVSLRFSTIKPFKLQLLFKDDLKTQMTIEQYNSPSIHDDNVTFLFCSEKDLFQHWTKIFFSKIMQKMYEDKEVQLEIYCTQNARSPYYLFAKVPLNLTKYIDKGKVEEKVADYNLGFLLTFEIEVIRQKEQRQKQLTQKIQPTTQNMNFFSEQKMETSHSVSNQFKRVHFQANKQIIKDALTSERYQKINHRNHQNRSLSPYAMTTESSMPSLQEQNTQSLQILNQNNISQKIYKNINNYICIYFIRCYNRNLTKIQVFIKNLNSILPLLKIKYFIQIRDIRSQVTNSFPYKLIKKTESQEQMEYKFQQLEQEMLKMKSMIQSGIVFDTKQKQYLHPKMYSNKAQTTVQSQKEHYQNDPKNRSLTRFNQNDTSPMGTKTSTLNYSKQIK